MNGAGYRQDLTPTGVPRSILILAPLALALGAFATPDVLISLGPMRASLSSSNSMVKENAHRLLTAGRIACVLLGVGLLCLATAWDRIAASPFARRIGEHEPFDGAPSQRPNHPFNASFALIGGALAIALLYVASGRIVLSRDQLAMINREDGFIEYASALLFFLCGVASLLLVPRFSGFRARTAMHLLMAVGFIAMAGEEISWGQRIFGWETSEAMRQLNVQGETNLHNLAGYFADHFFILAVFLYGFVFPVLAYQYPFFRKFFDYLGLPIASMGLALGFLMISITHDWTIYRILPRFPGLRIAELRELLTAIAFALLMYESWIASGDGRGKAKHRSILG